MVQISYIDILTKAVSDCMKCTRGCNYPVHWLIAFVVCSNDNFKEILYLKWFSFQWEGRWGGFKMCLEFFFSQA